jgi:GGDEF domain-containing protein
VLAAFGALLSKQMQPTEIVARLRGEEFVVLLPNTDLEKAVAASGWRLLTLASSRCPNRSRRASV